MEKAEQSEKDNAEQIPTQLLLFEPDEIVRPDYNIGKYATLLFASPYLKNLDETRYFEWEVPLNEGVAKASITIRPSRDKSVPTTTTLKIFLALTQLWKIQGLDPSGRIYFSDRQLAKIIGWAFNGAVSEKISLHMEILQSTSIKWELSFKTKKGTEKLVSNMSLVNQADHIDRRLADKKQFFSANHIVELNKTLVQNMIDNIVRPMKFTPIRQINSDVSTRLYIMIDLFLSNKRKWERRSYDLLTKELGYTGARYEIRHIRKQKLQQLCKDLDGKELGTGKLALSIAETADGEDWKLVARKIPCIVTKRKKLRRILNEEDATSLAADLLTNFDNIKKAGKPKTGYMIFLCQHYPEHIIRDAISRAKADYRDNVKKSIGACFSYELETLVRTRTDLHWYRDDVERTSTAPTK